MAAMVEHSALESLVQRLGSLNEANDDEAEAVSNTLAIFENIVELSPQVRPLLPHQVLAMRDLSKRLLPASICLCSSLKGHCRSECATLGPAVNCTHALCATRSRQVVVSVVLLQAQACEGTGLREVSEVQVAEELVSRTKVLNWMLKRLKPREFDVNKGAVGESLALLLQSSQTNAQKAADLNGIDAILQVLSQGIHLMDRCSCTMAVSLSVAANQSDNNCIRLGLPG